MSDAAPTPTLLTWSQSEVFTRRGIPAKDVQLLLDAGYTLEQVEQAYSRLSLNAGKQANDRMRQYTENDQQDGLSSDYGTIDFHMNDLKDDEALMKFHELTAILLSSPEEREVLAQLLDLRASADVLLKASEEGLSFRDLLDEVKVSMVEDAAPRRILITPRSVIEQGQSPDGPGM